MGRRKEEALIGNGGDLDSNLRSSSLGKGIAEGTKRQGTRQCSKANGPEIVQSLYDGGLELSPRTRPPSTLTPRCYGKKAQLQGSAGRKPRTQKDLEAETEADADEVAEREWERDTGESGRT